MKYSEILKIQQDPEFYKFVEKELQFDDDYHIDTIDLDQSRLIENIRVQYSYPSNCACCGYNYGDMYITETKIDNIFKLFMNKKAC